MPALRGESVDKGEEQRGGGAQSGSKRVPATGWDGQGSVGFDWGRGA